MKALYIGMICLVLVSACKSETSKTAIQEDVNTLTIGEKIAHAHGFENWKNVSEVKIYI
jgi:hypothetical protein